MSSSGALSAAYGLAAARPLPPTASHFFPSQESPPEDSRLRAFLPRHGENHLPGGPLSQPFGANQPPPPRTTFWSAGQTLRIARPSSTEGLYSPESLALRGMFASPGGLVSPGVAVPSMNEPRASDASASRRASPSEAALSGVKDSVKVSFNSPEKRGRPPKTEVDLESIREFISRGPKRPMLSEDHGTPRNGQSVYQSLHADNLLMQMGLENPSPGCDWSTNSEPGSGQQRGDLGTFYRACSEPAFESPEKSAAVLNGVWEQAPGDSRFEERAPMGSLARGFGNVAHMRRFASEPNLGALGANEGLVSTFWQPGSGLELGPGLAPFEPGTLGGAESARLNIAGILHGLPPSRGGVTPRKAALLTLEDLTPCFDMPMAEACKALGVGATVRAVPHFPSLFENRSL